MTDTDSLADQVLQTAVERSIDLVREGLDPYWTLLHAGLTAEMLTS